MSTSSVLCKQFLADLSATIWKGSKCVHCLQRKDKHINHTNYVPFFNHVAAWHCQQAYVDAETTNVHIADFPFKQLAFYQHLPGTNEASSGVLVIGASTSGKASYTPTVPVDADVNGDVNGDLKVVASDKAAVCTHIAVIKATSHPDGEVLALEFAAAFQTLLGATHWHLPRYKLLYQQLVEMKDQVSVQRAQATMKAFPNQPRNVQMSDARLQTLLRTPTGQLFTGEHGLLIRRLLELEPLRNAATPHAGLPRIIRTRDVFMLLGLDFIPPNQKTKTNNTLVSMDQCSALGSMLIYDILINNWDRLRVDALWDHRGGGNAENVIFTGNHISLIDQAVTDIMDTKMKTTYLRNVQNFVTEVCSQPDVTRPNQALDPIFAHFLVDLGQNHTPTAAELLNWRIGFFQALTACRTLEDSEERKTWILDRVGVPLIAQYRAANAAFASSEDAEVLSLIRADVCLQFILEVWEALLMKQP